MKQQKHVYRYDDCGNMVYEYMRGNGTGEATIENTYAYDALHRVISAHEDYGNKTRTYTYDSLGNLAFETEHGNKSVDYRLNNLNQITQSSDDGWKTSTAYTYDLRGNLTQETYTKNKKVSAVGAYIYDETNKMVSGTNENGEVSNYIYNGLGALVENQWIITKNGYGYHDVDAGNAVVTYPATGLHNSSTVIKQFVVDYTSETFEPLMEHEINGFDYRYVYGNARLSVDIKGVTTSSGNLIENGDHIRLYYHMDYLGTADYLTSPVSGKVTSWTHYNEWGEITHNAVLKCGQRELDMVKRYATHDFDSVLGQYYAKARFYDAGSRRFTAMDPIKDGLNWYAYCESNPVVRIDISGKASGVILAGTKLVNAADQSWMSSGYVKLRELIDIINKSGVYATVGYDSNSHTAYGYVDGQYYSIKINNLAKGNPTNYVRRSIATIKVGNGTAGSKYFSVIFCVNNSTNYVKLSEFVNAFGLSEKVQFVDWSLVNYITQSDVDKGVRLKTINGKQYLDVTVPVETAVYNEEGIFASKNMLLDVKWFINQVNHGERWDIKRKTPWEDTIGTTFPGTYNTEVVFQGKVSSPEIIGNMTYGYLGSAMGYTSFDLLVGGDVAAKGIDSMSDKAAILQGVNWYYLRHPRPLWIVA